jgi:hypothetical protein
MRLGDRRVFEQIAWAIGDFAVEALGALVHAVERRGCSQKLERAARREPFVGAMPDRRAGSRVEYKDAKPAALARFDLGEPLLSEAQALLG